MDRIKKNFKKKQNCNTSRGKHWWKILQHFLGKVFLDMIPQTRPIKEYIVKMNFMEMETFALQQTVLREWKDKYLNPNM